MSDFYGPMTTQVCRQPRKCIFCGETIEKGQTYHKQSGVWDGRFFTNRYHPECWDEVAHSDFDDGFTPYSNDRPPSAGELEFRSWDPSFLALGRLL